jgi:hypothetical protein
LRDRSGLIVDRILLVFGGHPNVLCSPLWGIDAVCETGRTWSTSHHIHQQFRRSAEYAPDLGRKYGYTGCTPLLGRGGLEGLALLKKTRGTLIHCNPSRHSLSPLAE